MTDRRPRVVRWSLDALWGAGAMWLITFFAALFHPNATVMGLLYLMVVLGLALWRGLVCGTVASVFGAALLNYYFLPPMGWSVESVDDVVALASFLIASTVASRLVVLARRRAAESEARAREVRALYDLSVELFSAGARETLPDALGRAFARLGAHGGALAVEEEGGGRLYVPFGVAPPPEEEVAPGVLRRSPTPAGAGLDLDIPLALDGRRGVLAVRGTEADPQAVESAARLVVLALERERFLAERLHLEALKESDAVKTALLRAVSHDLRTPLTAIRLKIQTLRRLFPPLPQGTEALGTITREVDNLKHRIDNLLSMARLQAGMSSPRPEPSPAADLFRAAREGLESVLEGREVLVAVADETPDVLVDPSLAAEILINLLENAAHASPRGAPLELTAGPCAGGVRLSVLDRGPGLPVPIAELMRRDPAASPETTGSIRRGLGLEIARGLAVASGGSVDFAVRPDGGTIVSVTLPAFQPAEEAEAASVRSA